MNKPVFKSNRKPFMDKHKSFMDMAFARLAMSVEVALKTTAGMPVKTGNMKSQTRHFKSENGSWRVEVDVAYAAFQEAGQRAAGGYRVRHYSTSGTSAGFFMRAIDTMLRQRNNIIMESKRAFNL
jgi:hypothetical protein